MCDSHFAYTRYMSIRLPNYANAQTTCDWCGDDAAHALRGHTKGYWGHNTNCTLIVKQSTMRKRRHSAHFIEDGVERVPHMLCASSCNSGCNVLLWHANCSWENIWNNRKQTHSDPISGGHMFFLGFPRNNGEENAAPFAGIGLLVDVSYFSKFIW